MSFKLVTYKPNRREYYVCPTHWWIESSKQKDTHLFRALESFSYFDLWSKELVVYRNDQRSISRCLTLCQRSDRLASLIRKLHAHTPWDRWELPTKVSPSYFDCYFQPWLLNQTWSMLPVLRIRQSGRTMFTFPSSRSTCMRSVLWCMHRWLIDEITEVNVHLKHVEASCILS